MLPTIRVKGYDGPVILIQGGMGAGISLSALAGAVASHGAIGTVSFIALDRFVEKRIGRKISHKEAAKLEIEEAKRLSQGRGAIAINCMVLVESTFSESVHGAIEGGVNIIIAGAGLPMALPKLAGNANVSLIPIVSSARALKLICQKWNREHKRLPDAVVLEGPLAGGHLGFKPEDITKPEFQLENIFGPVKEIAQANGDFPVIVAGGIFTNNDIVRWMKAGADGVQMGTRFAATKESGASEEFKAAIVACSQEDIEVAVNPGSPSGLPFRIINTSSGYRQALEHSRPLSCNKHYLLHKNSSGHLTCLALEGYEAFCICNGLLSAAGCNNTPDELPLFTVGASAYRVDKILAVAELISELKG